MAKRERTVTHAKPRQVYELQHAHKQCRARKVAAPATPGSTRDASHPGGSQYGSMMHRHGVQASLRITPHSQTVQSEKVAAPAPGSTENWGGEHRRLAKRERTATHAKPRQVYELQHAHKQFRARIVAEPATPGSTRDASHPGGSKYGNLMHRHGVQASLRITPRTRTVQSEKVAAPATPGS